MQKRQQEKKRRRTPQRMAILAYLKGNAGNPTAEEIHRALALRFPTMSLATVYNTLRLLRREGNLIEMTVDKSRLYIDPETRPHHHVTCLECGKQADVFSELDVAVGPAEASGFRVIRSEVSFYGYCPDCLRKMGRARAKKVGRPRKAE